LKRVT